MAPPKNLDEEIMDTSRRKMKSFTNKLSKKSKKDLAPTRFNAYQKELHQLIKTKRDVESRPLKVQFAKLASEAKNDQNKMQEAETQTIKPSIIVLKDLLYF